MTRPFHTLYHQAARTLVPLYAADIVQAMADANLDTATYDWLIHVYGQHPKPFTLADWLTFYRTDGLMPEQLAQLYDDGHLLEQDGGFVLVDDTVTWLREHLAADRAALSGVPTAPFDLIPLVEKFQQLTAQDVVKAHTRHLQPLRPGPGAMPLVQIDHALTELTTTLDADGLDALTEQVFSSEEQVRLRTDLKALLQHLYRQVVEKIWELIGKIRLQLIGLVRADRDAAGQAVGYAGMAWRPLQWALTLDPPTLDALSQYRPYENPVALAATWDGMVAEGVLEKQADGRYIPTAKGRDQIGQIFGAIDGAYQRVQNIPHEQAFDLHALLNRVLTTAIHDPAIYTFAAQATSRLQPPRPHPLSLLGQLFDELWAFRDDAHVAAWRGLGVAGYQWETLSYVWLGIATTPAELGATLAHRGYAAADYAEGLADLARREWVAANPDGYTLTEEGRRIREQAERDTDDTFYGALLTLDDAVPTTYQLLAALHYGLGTLGG